MGGHKNWAALGLALALLTAGCGLPDPKVAVDSPSGESASTQTAQATEASAPAAGARPAADSAPAGRTAPTRPDVSLADVAGAWVPANCDLPRQNLT